LLLVIIVRSVSVGHFRLNHRMNLQCLSQCMSQSVCLILHASEVWFLCCVTY